MIDSLMEPINKTMTMKNQLALIIASALALGTANTQAGQPDGQTGVAATPVAGLAIATHGGLADAGDTFDTAYGYRRGYRRYDGPYRGRRCR
jgi:hypothetical protein